MSLILIAIESTFYFLALLAGIIAFRSLNLFYRLIFLQVCLNVANYSIAYGITVYNRLHGVHGTENNHWLFNSYTLLECTVLVLAGVVRLQNKTTPWFAGGGYLAFLAVFFYQVSDAGFGVFANDAACFEGVLVVTIYLLILYRQFVDAGETKSGRSDTWLCLGMVLYFACIIPYLSMIYYLQRTNQALTMDLYNKIILGFENLRYLFITISFFLCWRARRSLIPVNYE